MTFAKAGSLLEALNVKSQGKGSSDSGRQNRTGGSDTNRQPDESISIAFQSGVPRSI
jgi:hypothetical protein